MGTVLILACAFAAQDDGWKALQRDAYTIRFRPVVEKDAQEIDGYLRRAVVQMSEEFADHDPQAILRSVASCVLILHDTPNAQANPAIATAITQRSERGYEAEIHLLAPSRHPPGLLDNVGKPMDGDYFFRLVVHEYSTVFLEQIRRRAGWRHAPDWFVQGYEEWLGLTRSTDRNRTERLDRYRKILKEDPARIDFSFGIDVREPYVDGVVLLDFLHAEFGRKRVQAILASPESSFGRAMRKELGVGLSEMERRFAAWRKRL